MYSTKIFLCRTIGGQREDFQKHMNEWFAENRHLRVVNTETVVKGDYLVVLYTLYDPSYDD